MYWKMEALTKTGRVITKSIGGTLAEIRSEAVLDELDILSLKADYLMYLQSIYLKRQLSTSTLARFFVDFARTQASGLSISETVDSLQEGCSNAVLKEGLTIINNSVNDGRTLKQAFENSKCFPRIVTISLSVAEKSGSVPEVSKILGDYFKFNNDSRKRIIGSLIYPASVFCALTVASIIISINLVPQLGKILPTAATNNIQTKLLLSYAVFMKSYWWAACLLLVLFIAGIHYLWTEHKETFAKFIYNLPLIGQTLKEIEFSRLFLNLYVYQKSGIPIIETIMNIYKEDKSYVNEKLLNIRNKIIKGSSLGDAFKSDDFFPVFIWHNMSKGQKTGNLVRYLEETYSFYDQKSKDSINILVSLINPVLLSLAIAFLGFIVCNFFLPIYQSMANMGGMFR
jgi:type II secretory pathway component PulF